MISFRINPEKLYYSYITTADEDFYLAEIFNASIKETYKSLKSQFEYDYKELTELCMVINWRCSVHYENGNIDIARIYYELQEDLENFIYSEFNEEELKYFYRTTN